MILNVFHGSLLLLLPSLVQSRLESQLQKKSSAAISVASSSANAEITKTPQPTVDLGYAIYTPTAVNVGLSSRFHPVLLYFFMKQTLRLK